MKNKFVLGLVLATLPLSLVSIGNAGSADAAKKVASQVKSGQIVGAFNSPDKTVVGATLPGKSVSFNAKATKGGVTYLHFAFMHAASGAKGWYFAPSAKTGIKLTKATFGKKSTINVTNKVGLFAAPTKSVSKAVKKSDGKLKFEKTNKFLKATVKKSGNTYKVTIKNLSKGSYKTPFSSGVFATFNKAKKSFDHTPSAALTKLATMGHRDDLYATVQKLK